MKSLLSSCLIALLVLSSCEDPPVPKRKGYPRVEFPAKEYVALDSDCPFTFQYSLRSLMESRSSKGQPCWYNLHYPQYMATIHMSHINLDDNLDRHIEESRKLAMKHLVKASNYTEEVVTNPEKGVHGIVFDFEGSTASNFQFYLTDSSDNFFRGAMYFNLPPNPDSLDPVINYIKEDMNVLIESFEWKGAVSAE